jgi:N-acetylglucosaminyldiphosphoundecaprenol N-acetyl-beta-D-mannosaminyltransferase
VKKLSILSVGIADVVFDELEGDIADSIRERRQLVIMYASMLTANLAESNAKLREALSSASIVHADGVGIWLSSRVLYGKGFRERFNWTDYAYEFMRKCSEHGWSIFFLGSTTAVLQTAMERLKQEIPGIKIAGMKDGFGDVESQELINSINDAHADILWVAMGAPKQELWIQRHRHELNCCVIQSVGDAMNQIAGVKRRGPKFLQRLGLEWLVRLFFDPIRFFSRYVIGIPVFAFRIVRQKLKETASLRS